MPYPGLLHPEHLPLQQSTADPYLHKRHSNTVLAQALGPGEHSLFEPSEHLWQVWGLILNTISPLLPSCWGFSFALGCEVSFFGGIKHSPIDGCSAESCNFGVIAGEDEHTSFYSSIFTLCLTQWNCKPRCVWSPKTDGSWWRVLTKCGQLEKGMANHFTILALRTSWTAWKGKKIGHWKMNLPGR